MKHFVSIALLTLAAFGTADAFAQQLDGGRPPVVSISDAPKVAPPPSSAAISTPITPGLPTIGGLPMPSPSAASPPAGGVLASIPPLQEKPKKSFKAPPLNLTVEPGKNTAFAIAVGHINRIVTPFAQPSLRTTSTAQTSIEGGIVYVATDSQDPIGVFIFDKGAPEQAISLTLVPDVIEPVSTTIQVSGWSGNTRATVVPKSSTRALAYESDHPYLETLTEILRSLAQGKIPDGYGLQDVSREAVAGMPRCEMPGISVHAMQVLDGGSFRAIVAKARNTSYTNNEIIEQTCSGRGLRAVAAWPYTRLAPGQETELYLLLSTVTEDDADQTRPSVIGGH